MFDDEKFSEWLEAYKRDLADLWPHERFKWGAVKTFRDNWDAEAADLRGMLEASLAGCEVLLTTAKRYPAGMLCEFAGLFPERVRSALVDLFDEGSNLWERIEAFKAEADGWHEDAVSSGQLSDKAHNHYQDENSITTYLWLRHPAKHFVYKYAIARTLWMEFGTGRPIKKGAFAANVRNDESTYEDIRTRLVADPDLRVILDSLLDGGCDRDETMHTLTIDFGHYVWKNAGKGTSGPSASGGGHAAQGWWPTKEEYDTGLTTEDWAGLIGDGSVFSDKSLLIMSRFLELGGQATCKQLSNRFGETVQYYIGGTIGLARRVAGKTGCPVLQDGNGSGNRWWPIVFQGRSAAEGTDGSYVWRMRDELRSALEGVGLPDPNGESPAGIADDDEEQVETVMPPYTKQDFLGEVYMSEERYDRLRGVLLSKKNLILQGAPGVGKTFCARRLAWSIMGERDDGRIEMVQFHQNYTYEDFIMGYKPDGEGFSLKEGVFYRFCKRAAADPASRPHFFIIDEINRGNLSKILGELMMLIESDYRGHELTLAYRDERFAVPPNLYLIGMMNTADRSLALIDYALRRRFAFFEMRPGFDSEVFTAYREGLNSETLDALVLQIEALNAEIRRDPTLGKGFEIGHSRLCGRTTCDDEWLRDVVDYDIVPTLEEYWFDDGDKVSRWKAALRGVFSQ